MDTTHNLETYTTSFFTNAIEQVAEALSEGSPGEKESWMPSAELAVAVTVYSAVLCEGVLPDAAVVPDRFAKEAGLSEAEAALVLEAAHRHLLKVCKEPVILLGPDLQPLKLQAP